MTEVHDRPALTLREAADACSVSLSTIKRRHRAGAFENAEQEPGGRWVIPVNDLLGAGFSLARPVTQASEPETQGSEPGVDHLVNRPDPPEIVDLRHEVAMERLRREHAEQLAAERLDLIEGYRTALRALEAAPTPAATEPEPAPTTPEKRRWWRPGG